MFEEQQRPIETDLLLEGISLLMDWRTVGTFRANAFLALPGGEEEAYELIASPRDLTYRLRDLSTGVVDSFDSETGKIISAGTAFQYVPHMLHFEPLPVRLVFTPSLGIWGRNNDDYRITGAKSSPDCSNSDDEIELTVAHTHDRSLTGTLTLSKRFRHAVRLDTPTLSCRYESIEPHE